MFDKDGRLQIFTNFEKFEFIKDKSQKDSNTSSTIFINQATASIGVIDQFQDRYKIKVTWWQKLKLKLFNPEKLFKQLKYNFKEFSEKEIQEKCEKYSKSLLLAKGNHQVSFYEKLTKKSKEYLKEIELLKSGIVYYITEDQVRTIFNKIGIDHRNYKQYNMKLTWLSNYTRFIPSSSSIKIQEYIKKDVFDNIVIMHYDLLNVASAPTQKQIERAKDPIAFGVIKGVNKLYFITDWVDEHCNLTFSKLVETLNIDLDKLEL